MSHSGFSHRQSHSMGINDEVAWRNTKRDHEDKSTSSRTPAPHSDATGLASLPLAPVRWSKGRIASDYIPLENSVDLLVGEEEKKDGKRSPLVTVEFKGFRSFTDMYPPESNTTVKRGVWSSWIRLAPHVLAVCATAAVCQLSFRNSYWMDLQPPNKQIAPGLTQGGVLDFLQLAAKLHELLILASISSIVLHTAHSRLRGRSGLPLGMVANSFELSSGQFLRRKSFWSLLWSVDPVTGKRFPYKRFWMLSFFSTILVTLAGPSSAIAIIPTLNYFYLPRPFNQTVLPYYVFNQSTELWPVQLTAASLNAPGSGNLCNDPDSETSQEICPVGGFRDTYNWAGGLLFGDTDQGTNISFPDSTGDTRRVLTAQSCNSTFDGRASATSLNAFISGAMTAYWIFAQQNFHGIALESAQPYIAIDVDAKIFAPRVEAMCNSYSNYYFDPENPNDQPNMTFPTFDDLSPVPVPDWTYKYTRPLNASNFTFVEILSNPLSPSLGAVLTLPLIENINGTWVQATENLACSMYSQWIPVDVWYEPTINDQVSYTITSSMSNTCLTPIGANSGRQPINTTIDADYANAINQPIAFIDSNIPALEAIYQRFIFNDSTYIPNGVIFRSPIPGVAGVVVSDDDARRQRAKLVSTVLAGVVTDGLARNAGDGAFPYSASMFLLPNSTTDGFLQGRFPVTSATGGEDDPLNTTNPADEAQWLRLNPAFQRYGYGYRWHENRTTQFGISLLLVHLVIALVYMVFVLCDILGRNGGIPSAWETIPEMFALAMNSRSIDRIRSSYAGVSDAAAVRVTSEGYLEIVPGRHEMY